MEPILDKSEISALLKAIGEGKVTLELDDNDQEGFLSCTPVDLFNLTRPDSDQFRVPNFDIILNNFCRLYSTSLANQLQRTFSITRTSLGSFEFQKFMAERHTPGAIGILDMHPLKHGSLMILDPTLSFSLIEIMLGASADLESPSLDRQLTTIELNILKTIISDACNDLNKAFIQLLELDTTLIKVENKARLVSIVEPEAEVIVGTFLAKVGDYSGEIHMIFPFATLEPLREPLRELLSITTATTSTWQNVLEDEVQDISATITAQSGTIALNVKQVLNMKVGDIVSISYDPNTLLKVLVEEKSKFTAVPGTHNGKKAISLTGVIT